MNKSMWPWIILAVLAGFGLAVFAHRRAYGKPRVVSNIPPSALPRYIGLGGFGEYYDPYGIWPYGTNSAYSILTNSGVPTSAPIAPGARSVATAPQNSILSNGHGHG